MEQRKGVMFAYRFDLEDDEGEVSTFASKEEALAHARANRHDYEFVYILKGHWVVPVEFFNVDEMFENVVDALDDAGVQNARDAVQCTRASAAELKALVAKWVTENVVINAYVIDSDSRENLT